MRGDERTCSCKIQPLDHHMLVTSRVRPSRRINEERRQRWTWLLCGVDQVSVWFFRCTLLSRYLTLPSSYSHYVLGTGPYLDYRPLLAETSAWTKAHHISWHEWSRRSDAMMHPCGVIDFGSISVGYRSVLLRLLLDSTIHSICRRYRYKVYHLACVVTAAGYKECGAVELLVSIKEIRFYCRLRIKKYRMNQS